MSMELPITEIKTQQVALETCDDPYVANHQIEALLQNNITVYKTAAKIGGATVNFTRLYNPNAEDSTPLVFGNGFCGTESAYKAISVETALRGRNVTFVKPPRIQGVAGMTDPRHALDPLLLQKQAIWLAGRETMKRLDCDQFDAYGHSMGGVTSAEAALHKLGSVRKLILAGSAGVDGKHTLRHRAVILPRVVRYDILEAVGEIHQHSGNEIAGDTLQHVLRRPLRTIREALAVARTDIRPTIDRLQDNGVKVGLIQFGRDGFFDVESVKKANVGRSFGDFRVIDNALHTYTQQQPGEHSYDIDAMLYDLDGEQRYVAA